MGMTMTQKILAAHAGLDHVEAGQLIEAQLDLVLGNDITSPVAIHEMDKMTVDTVFDKDKIALVMDHFIPNKDIKSAEHCKCVREFACRHDITNYFDVGQMGIEHALLPEKGLTVAGDVIIGADSHTCTYGALGAFSTGVGSTDMAAGMATGKAWFKVPSAIKFNIVGKPKKWVSGKDVILHIIGMIGVDGALYKSMEFVGEGIKNLSMDDRFTIANMAIEAGGKNGIFPVDDLAIEYMKEHSKRPYTAYEADEDAVYEAEYTIDLSTLEPTVAFPHLPENTKTISEIGEPVVVDQSVIGSCTNGRIDDLRVAARILKGRKVKKGLRCIVIPATQAIYYEVDILRTDYNIDRLVFAESDIDALEFRAENLDEAVLNHNTVNNVAVADEVCNECVLRLIVNILRCTNLLDISLVHDNDRVGHRKGFFLIVGNIDESDAKLVFQADQLVLHILSEL